MIKFIILFIFIFVSSETFAKLSEEENVFLKKVFNESVPKKKRLILKGEGKIDIKKIMGDKYNKKIFSYWEDDVGQVWILNNIGKYKPITAGFVINDCKIKSSHVIVYREQHGYEIKYPNFLQQLKNAMINSKMKLNVKVDNISGATLSVNSMKKMAAAALLLHKLTNEDTCS